MAQAMTIQTFLDTADRIPDNFTAMFSPDARRLKREADAAMTAVFREQMAARSAGRRSYACMPARFTFDTDELRAYFEAMPARQRATLTTTEGLRRWTAARFPCPA